MEEEIGSQILTIFPSEKNEVCTKVEQIEANTISKVLQSFVAAKELIRATHHFFFCTRLMFHYIRSENHFWV